MRIWLCNKHNTYCIWIWPSIQQHSLVELSEIMLSLTVSESVHFHIFHLRGSQLWMSLVSLLHHKKHSLLTALEKHSRANDFKMGNLMVFFPFLLTPHIWFSYLSIVIHFDMLFHINKAMWLEACRWPMDCVGHKNPYRHSYRALSPQKWKRYHQY